MTSLGRTLAACAASLLLAGRAEPVRADDFTNARMAAGMDAYRSRRFPEAAEQLRIACFGLLDQPAVLSEALVWLAFAHEAAGAKADVETTLVRFLDVERRFGVYAKSRLDAPTRTEFEKLLRTRIAPDAIAAVPSLAAILGKAAPGTPARKAP